MTGMAGLLWTANRMLDEGFLTSSDVESLAEVVPLIFDSSAYADTSPWSREAASVSLVRASCVRLARDILSATADENSELLEVLEAARSDALPEVRFAVEKDANSV